MSKPPRDHASFGSNTYFVTTSTWGHRSIFQAECNAKLLIDTLFHYRRDQKYQLHVFVVMPDHIHLLLSPTGIALERAMQLIKGGFSYRVKKELGLNMEVWERGYVDHRVRDYDDYEGHEEYILQNPVVAGLSKSAVDFPYSSLHFESEMDPRPQGLKPVINKSA